MWRKQAAVPTTNGAPSGLPYLNQPSIDFAHDASEALSGKLTGREELNNHLRGECWTSDEAMSAQTSGTAGHPIRRAPSPVADCREPGNRFRFPRRARAAKIHESACIAFGAAETKISSLGVAQKSCLTANGQIGSLPVGQITINAEEQKNSSFSRASVGRLGVTRHRAAAVHWLALLLGGLSFSRLHGNAHN